MHALLRVTPRRSFNSQMKLLIAHITPCLMTDSDAAPEVAAVIERNGVREVARQAAAHVAADLETEFAAAPAKHRFKLGVAFEAFGHARHFLRHALRAASVTVAHQLFALALQLLPSLHKAVGTDRKRVVTCKRVSVRLDPGGAGTIKNTKN